MTIEVEEDQNKTIKRNEILSHRELEKAAIRDKLGEAKYDEIYNCLVYHRSHDETNERDMYNDVKQRLSGVKEMLNWAFKLDNIVFHEMVLENLNSQAH